MEPGRILVALVLLLCSVDLSLSLTHALEAPPRLWSWPLDLWREATVFHGQFALFGVLGGPVEIATILGTALLAFLWRGTPGARLAAFGAALFALALVSWIVMVAPANAELATWTPGPLPTGANATRLRWEEGHLLGAALKLAAFLLVVLAVAQRLRPKQPQRD